MIRKKWRVFLRRAGHVLWVLTLVPLLGLAGCLGPGEGFPEMEEKGMPPSPPGKGLERARGLLEQRLFGVPGFAGIAHDEAEGVIYVFLENEEAKKNVPDFFEGFRVQKRVTGRFKALGFQTVTEGTSVLASRTGEVRPLVGGISLSAYVTDRKGNIKRYAGTLGIVTQKNKNIKILSNAHIIAMDPETSTFLRIGTSVIQPGSLDGGTLANKVGNLEQYIPITFNSFRRPNYADAAIASIDKGIGGTPGAQFGGYTVSGTIEVIEVGDGVRKSGRTTGVTTSTVENTNASVIVFYGNKWAYFKEQILVDNQRGFVDAGDSGSCVDKDGKFVGLVFAGSSDLAVVCRAKYILPELGISI